MDLLRTDIQFRNFHGMCARSPQMAEVFRLLERAARSDITVMLRGESGTGKEMAARALHTLGRRSRFPFQAVNCATFTSDLLASRLFGHVKGAFTGAVRDRDGILTLADRGTLFLDEVAEIPIDLQGRLLRVLQDHTFVPVGGGRERKVDIRVVSATNASLRTLVAERKYREDLMYRLRVVILRLPPLREREGDLELLTWRMVDRLNATEQRTIEQISRPAWEAMNTYRWPGNVRELENVLQAAYVLGDGPTLTLDELPPELRGEAADELPLDHEPEPVTLADRERQKLLDAWEAHHGKRGPMANALGWSRSTLYRKLKAHGLA